MSEITEAQRQEEGEKLLSLLRENGIEVERYLIHDNDRPEVREEKLAAMEAEGKAWMEEMKALLAQEAEHENEDA